MASPPSAGQRQWTASSWRSLVYPEVVQAPHSPGVVILGDAHREPLLVTCGIVHQEVWRLFNDARCAERGAAFYRFVETRDDAAAKRLGEIVLRSLRHAHGDGIAWKDFPAPPSFASSPDAAQDLRMW